MFDIKIYCASGNISQAATENAHQIENWNLFLLEPFSIDICSIRMFLLFVEFFFLVEHFGYFHHLNYIRFV